MSPLGRQTLAAIGPLLMILCGSFVGGYTTILVSRLKAKGSEFPLTMSAESWLASLPTIAMAMGSLFGGWFLELVGRRATSILVILINIVGWGFIHFARGMPHLMIGRFVTGFCTGVCSPTSSSYLGEMASPKYRPFFTAAVILFTSLGIFLIHTLSLFFRWRVIALWAMLLPLAAAVGVVFAPESHLWYIRKNRLKESRKAFNWFRGENCDEELQELMRGKANATKARTALLDPSFRKPLSIVVLLFFTILKTSPYAIKYLGFSITFFAFATFTLIGISVLYFVQPETRGKTIKEIEDYFKS